MILRLAAFAAAVATAFPAAPVAPNAVVPCRPVIATRIAAPVPGPPSATGTARATAELQASVAAHAIPDAEIDANIDPRLPQHVRDLVRIAMEQLPPFARDHVAGVAADGTFFANRWDDYRSHLQDTAPNVRLGPNVWRKPNGEVIVTPGIPEDAAEAQPQPAAPAAARAAPCPASPAGRTSDEPRTGSRDS